MLKQEAISNLKKYFDNLYNNRSLDACIINQQIPDIEQFKKYLHYHFTSMVQHITKSVVIELPALNYNNNGVPHALKEYYHDQSNELNSIKVVETMLNVKPPFETILYKLSLKDSFVTSSIYQSSDLKLPSYVYMLTIYDSDFGISAPTNPNLPTLQDSRFPIVIPIFEYGDLILNFPLINMTILSDGSIASVFPAYLNGTVTADVLLKYFTSSGISVAHSIPFLLLLWSNTLLNCKNVSLVKVEPKPLNKKKRKGGKPSCKLTSHHVIHVNNDRKVTPPTKVSWEDRDKVAMTNVDVKMGHFKTYTKERPLLGKHVGTWWWSPILKDNAANKVTYKVKENV